MRLPRPRLSLRTLIALVAIVALGIGGYVMKRRRDNFLSKVALFAILEQESIEAEKAAIAAAQSSREFAKAQRLRLQDYLEQQKDSSIPEFAKAPPPPEGEPDEHEAQAKKSDENANYARRHVARSRQLKLRYERAARFPWLFVPPDPPEPE